MSVESEILRIQHNIANAYAAVSQKGGEVPLQPTSANLAASIMTISGSPPAMDWLDIAMTSNNTPAPYQASAKSYVAQYGDAWVAFDGDPSTFWHSGIGDIPNWIKIDFGRKVWVDAFKLLQRPDYTGSDQAPKIFTFKGSNNGTTWTTIASYAEIPQGSLYQLTDPVQYRYYMLDNIRSTSNDAVCIAEWLFHGSVESETPGGGGSGGGVPKGTIVIWSGTASNIPEGWALCDGANGTPDLRDKFVLGGGGTHTVSDTGGTETVTLTVDQIPSHNHKVSTSGATHNNTLQTIIPVSGILDSSTEFYQANATVPTGGSQAHNNMPPYYTLCYIIKVSESGGGSTNDNQVWSTDEVVIGTWYDGRPRYRLVVPFTVSFEGDSIPANYNSIVQRITLPSLTNMDPPTSTLTGNCHSRCLNAYSKTIMVTTQVDRQFLSIRAINLSDTEYAFKPSNGNVVLEYCKTTDTPAT